MNQTSVCNVRIFTDASVNSEADICVSSFLILIDNKFGRYGTHVFNGRSTTIAELIAILKGCHEAIKLLAEIDEEYTVTVYSDCSMASNRSKSFYPKSVPSYLVNAIDELRNCDRCMSFKISLVKGHTMGYKSPHTFVDRLSRATVRKEAIKCL